MEQVHSAPGAVKASMPLRFLRSFRKLPRAGQVVLGGATLVALFGLFFAEENWRGERAWEKCRRQLEAKGVELDWSKFAPAPVPDEQNFAMTPFLAPLFDFNPRPLQPGQKLWRDTVSVERAQNFGAELLPADKPGQIPRRKLEGQLTDLEAVLLQLKRQSNASAAFDSRTASAAAVLDTLKDYRPVLDELQAASRHPFTRF